jgi:hypothetical protein
MSPIEALVTIVLFFVIFVVILKVGTGVAKAARKKMLEKLAEAAKTDSTWNAPELEQCAKDVFYAFQKAWSDLDIAAMQSLLTEKYYRRMVLELNVLQNQKRRNIMEDVYLSDARVISMYDNADNAKDRVTVQMTARARDTLFDTAEGKNLFVDRSSFVEYWTFLKEEGSWQLDIIKQATESVAMVESKISDFAERNGFFYDPDFGWLMMPNKGVIFGATNFGSSDINNHVIGYYREKIVEFYTYIPKVGKEGNVQLFQKNYVVAQAILPISYRDILIRKRSALLNFAPRGLRPISLEFGDFNKKFFVCADPSDSVSSLELLTLNFMEKIYDLPFDLNIEIVGNVLYFYTLDRKASYDQLLEILSWAFDEMKM